MGRQGKQLTPLQLQAAVLEAQGAPRRDIARVVGRSEKIVTNWRKDEAYSAEVDRLKSRHAELIEPLIQRVRIEVVKGAEDAITSLRDALEATGKDEARPNWNVRLRAAEGLRVWFSTLALVPEEGGGQGSASAQAAVFVVQGVARPGLPDPAPRPAIEGSVAEDDDDDDGD